MSEPSHRFFARKRLFVAGCGYIGGRVARQGIAQGLEVYALTRNPDKAAALRNEGVNVIVADLATDDWHGQLPGKMDFVLNSVSSGGGGAEGYRRSYYDGMASLLQWARRAQVGTCVYTSSTSVYPQGDGAVVDESATLDIAGDDRVRVLIATENLLRENIAGAVASGPASARPATNEEKSGNTSGVGRAFILRLAGIYGPGRHHVLDQIRAGSAALPGSGAHRLNLIHRDDAAAAIWAAFGAPTGLQDSIYNVADDYPVPKAVLADWLATQLGKPPPRFDANLPSRRQRVVPDRVIANAKLKRDLGWRPQYPHFRAGYADILAAQD